MPRERFCWAEDGAVVEVGTLADDAKTFELSIATSESRFGILILYAAELDDDTPARNAGSGRAGCECAREREAARGGRKAERHRTG